jgi:transcriptional regulator of acetoin/glycerol metabolism
MRGLQTTEQILDSWKKCKKGGVMSTALFPIIQLEDEELEFRLSEKKTLISIFDNSLRDIKDLLKSSCHYILTDSTDILLKAYNVSSKKKCVQWLKPGISFAEKSIGTNAIALSTISKKATYILPQQHYCDFLKIWYCYNVPLWVNKEILGNIAVLTFEQPLAKETIAVMELLVQQIIYKYMNVLRENTLGIQNKVLLNKRQLAILNLVAKGLTDTAIAIEMKLSLSTIKYHKQNIFVKLGVSCSMEAVVKALKLNLMSIYYIDI